MRRTAPGEQHRPRTIGVDTAQRDTAGKPVVLAQFRNTLKTGPCPIQLRPAGTKAQ